MNDEPLDKADYDSVYAAMAELERQGLGRGTLNDHVETWEALVEEVEGGYSWDVSEYRNDLRVRTWLDRAMPLLTPRVRASLAERLAPLDERFRAATLDYKLGKEWWFRLPRIREGDLALTYGPGPDAPDDDGGRS